MALLQQVYYYPHAVPIPKNKRGNKSDLNNYRQIAISSLLGKLFDISVLEEQHHSLITDELQFGFKRNASSLLCTSFVCLCLFV